MSLSPYYLLTTCQMPSYAQKSYDCVPYRHSPLVPTLSSHTKFQQTNYSGNNIISGLEEVSLPKSKFKFTLLIFSFTSLIHCHVYNQYRWKKIMWKKYHYQKRNLSSLIYILVSFV